MAKKPKTPVETAPENEIVGQIQIFLHPDGTYTLNTNVNPNPLYLSIYANMIADISEGKITNDIIKIFASSEDQENHQIAQFITLFLKTVKAQGKPLIAPNRVFRKNKMK